MIYEKPKYVIEVHTKDRVSQFVVRAESREIALHKARLTYPTARFAAPVRYCVHPLDKLIHADGRTVSPRRAERIYQCQACGDYVYVKVSK